MAATTIQRALTCSPRAVAMIASAIVPRMPTRTQGPCVRRVVVMACSVPAGFCFPADYAPATLRMICCLAPLPPERFRVLQSHRLSQENDMHRKLIAACLLSLALMAAPAMAQTPAPGPTPPTPQQPGATGGGGDSSAQTTAPGTEDSQGKVIGTPKEPGSTAAQSWAQAVPISYVVLAVLLVTGAVLYVLYRRRRRG